MKITKGHIIKSVSVLSATLMLGASAAHAQFPGTNGRFITTSIGGYISGTAIGTGVYTWKNDGTNPHQFTFPFVNTGLDTSASFSPDGTKIAYIGEYVSGNGNVDVLVKNADESGSVVRVTSNAANDVHPRWSPDGTKIVFTRENAGDSQVVVANSDGSGSEVAITNNGGGDGKHGVFTPDGTQIVFLRGIGSSIDIADSTGTESNASTIINPADVVNNLDVSPDGATVVYDQQETASSASIRTVAIGGGSPTVIVAASNNKNNVYPSYSPDGTKISYISQSSSSSQSADEQLVVYTIAGSTSTNVISFTNADGGSIYTATWGTNNGNYTTNVGGDAFNTGLPDTGTKSKNPFNNVLPAILAAGAVLLLGAFGFVWYKREFGRKNR